MSKVLVVTWDGAGNLVSTFGVAKRLVSEGHDVRVLGHRSIQERCGDHGWRFRAFEHTADWDATQTFDVESEMPFLSERVWFSAAVARDVADELERESADVVLVDAMLFGAMCATEALGTPTVALFHTASALFRGGPMVDMMAPAIPVANAIRADLGLAPVAALSEIHDACAASIVAVPQEFEPPMPVPANVTHIGPVVDAPPLVRSWDDVELPAGSDPLIVVSMSTSHQGQVETLQRLIDAMAKLSVRVVVTSGPSVDPGTLDAPDNTRVLRFVPHDQLLAQASLVVTHAGLGTVMSALARGVPLLCVPMGRDQFFNASQVAELGAGRMLAMDAYPAAIAAAVERVLADDGVRDAAKRFAEVIAGYGGATTATKVLERVVRDGEPARA